MSSKDWIARKTTDENKVKFFKKHGFHPLKIETKKGEKVYSYSAEETKLINIAWKALKELKGVK